MLFVSSKRDRAVDAVLERQRLGGRNEILAVDDAARLLERSGDDLGHEVRAGRVQRRDLAVARLVLLDELLTAAESRPSVQ